MTATVRPFLLAAALSMLVSCGKDAPPPVPAPAVTSAPAATPIAPFATAKPASVTTPQSASSESPDATLAGRVREALAGDAALAMRGIDVTASDGTVSLFGTVDSTAESRRAARLAAATQGVGAVKNELKVMRGS